MNIPLVDLKKRYNSLKNEIDLAIKNVIDNAVFINGFDVQKLEEEFSAYCGAKFGIGCGNGTVALDLVLRCIGIKAGDEVITVPNTFIATTEAISNAGGIIKFVDVCFDTMLMDVSKVEVVITSRTKAIIPVHLYGQMVDMDKLKEIADKHNLIIIEDSAQCHGAEQNNKKAPYFGLGTFSFFPAKIIGAFGDAGMVIVNDENVAKKIKMLSDHGRSSKYEHFFEGYNYRLDNLHAAILRVMLTKLDEWVDVRRKKARLYNELLKDIVEIPVERKYNKHAYYMYVIKVEKRDELMMYLKENGVSCGIHYPIPLHLQPAYKHLNFGSFPITENCAKKILSLPLYPEISDEEIRYVCGKIRSFYETVRI